MTVKGEIAEYRERLDKTLASHDLTDEETLKSLVMDHVLRSSEHDTQESMRDVVDKRTAELSNYLGMMRSASDRNDGVPQQPTWKLKQDTEEIRVMYREGPEGSPFHTLLVEGFVDAPLDACLCVSIEASLYPTWFPETRVPTFKVMLAQCIRRVRIGENISLVRFFCYLMLNNNSLEGRMKLSWPLSNREALLHYFEFEYLKDGLVIVLLNTPGIERIQNEILDFSNDEIPEADQTVRVDLVGGFALQKVTRDRTYFRTTATMDLKLDFVPPWFINFISRQLIGTGFKLYKKIVTSKLKDDANISKALNGPLYTRIRQAMGPNNDENVMNDDDNTLSSPKKQGMLVQGELKDEQVIEALPGHKPSINMKSSSEIVEEGSQEIKDPEDDGSENHENTEKESMLTTRQTKANHVVQGRHLNHKSIHVSPQVQEALGTLDKAIHVIREARGQSHGQAFRPSGFSNKGSPKVDIAEDICSNAEDSNKLHMDIAAPLTPPNAERIDRTSQDFSSTNNIHGLRPSSNTKELNPNRQAPGSPELVLSSSDGSPQAVSHLMETGSMGTPNSNKAAEDDNGEALAAGANGIHENGAKKTGHHKKWRMCCLHLVSGRLVSS